MFHRIEIPVVVQEGQRVMDAVGSDDQVNRFSDRYAERSQMPEVTRRLDRELFTAKVNHWIRCKRLLYAERFALRIKAPQKLAKHEIADQNVSCRHQLLESCNPIIASPAGVVDQH